MVSPRLARSLGITVGGVILLLQAVGFVGISMFLVPTHLGAASTYGALALVMAVTAIGVFRLRSWARVMVLAMSGYGLFLSGFILLLFSWLGFLGSHRFVAVIGVIFGLPWIALSLWWLYILNRPSVKQQFQGAWDRTGRPLSITVIALVQLTAPFFMLLGLLLPGGFAALQQPFSRVMGVEVPVAVSLGFALLASLVGVGLGIGLWRLRPWARRATIWYLAVMFLNALLSVVSRPLAGVPPPDARISQAQWSTILQMIPLIVIVSSTLTTLLAVWFLITRRKSFSL